MGREIEKRKQLVEGILSVVIPSILFLLLCRKLHITPFGDKTFMYEDMKRQYIDFYGYYKAVLHGRDGFFYSDNSGIGANMLGTWAYYLTSPFLLMFAFVPESMFPSVLTAFIMVKISAVSLFMYILLKGIDKRFGNPENASLEHSAVLVVCAVAFSYSGWMIANMTNSMWLDAVMILPLFCLALIKVLGNEKYGFLCLALATMFWILANYYIAAMSLLFMGLFVLLLFALRFVNLRQVLKVAGAVFTGIILDLWFIVPVLHSLSGSNKDYIGSTWEVLTDLLPLSEERGKSISPFSVLSKLFTMSYDTKEILTGLPNIYFGAALLIPLVMYFLNRKIQKKEKIAALISLAVLMLFFCDKLLDTLAHGGAHPCGYYYRYSFIFSFLCILVVYRQLCNMEGSSIKGAAIAFGGVLIAFVLAKLSGQEFFDMRMLMINLAVVAMSFATMLIMLGHAKDMMVLRLSVLAFAFVLLTELSLNFIVTYNTSSLLARGEREYQEKSSAIEQKVAAIKKADEGKYRIESLSPMTPNDGLHFGYDGVTSYNSLIQVEDRLLLFRLGFNDNGLYTPYEAGNTRTADALLGIKYLLCDDVVAHDGQEVFAEGTIMNTNVLPTTVINGENVLETLTFLEDSDNPFQVQQRLLSRYCGKGEPVFRENSAKKVTETDERVTYHVTAQSDGEMYFYMNRVNMEERALAVFVDEKFLSGYGNASAQKVLDLGHYSAGDEFDLVIATDGKPLPAEPTVVTENVEALAKYVKEFYRK